MQVLIYIIYLVVLLLLQNHLPFKVDLLLLFLISTTLWDYKLRALLSGFGGGLVLDCLAGFGFVSTLGKTLGAVLANLLRVYVTLEKYPFAFLLVIILTPAVFLVEAAALNLFYHFPLRFWPLLVELLKLMLFNLLFMPLIYWVFQKSFGE